MEFQRTYLIALGYLRRYPRNVASFLAQKCSIPTSTTLRPEPIHGHLNTSKQAQKMTEGPYDCDARIQLRLAGLNGGLNFLLFRNQGCRVNVTIEQGSTTRVIAGIICNVGTNFVDIKQKADKVVTILQERIVHIEWLDRSIGSCTRSGHRACHYLDFEETEEE